MMTKRIYKKMLTAAAVAVLGFAMVSCVDNFDNSTTPSEQEQQAEDAQQAKAQKFWSVVSQLVDVDDYTDDYEGKTFEPTYGVEGSEEGTRYVFTNDAATAAERFADLVEQGGIDENTEQYTYDDPDVGKLVYTKGSGRILATVDVDIKQIPSLKKIVYVPGAYANGSFQGRAYYRFGDVVKRQVLDYDGNNVDEYWICVRPSFGPESKGDSHWVCLNVLPKKNVWFYHSDNSNRDYYLPTGLGKNEEHMQNLAEMLYAIYYPNEWQTNVSDAANTSLRMFHDFNKTKYTLHNKYFWMDVYKQWKEKEILKKALNYSAQENDFRALLSGDGIRLLHSGLSWMKTFSWNCSLYEAHYQNGTEPKEKNMHKATLDEPAHNMENTRVDCRKTGLDNYDKYKEFFDDDHHPRWTIRHATGKELVSGAKYDKQRAIQGVEEVYRYYRDVEPTADDAYATTNPEETPAEVAKDKAKVGYIIANNGKIYRSYVGAQENGEGAAAMVVWIGDDKRVEKDKDWNALAIALDDIEQLDGQKKFLYCAEADKNVRCTNVIATSQQIPNRLDGWAMTKRMHEKACGKNHTHTAADLTWNKPRIEGFSEWFIPSAGQWNLAVEGQGYGALNDMMHYTKEGEWLWREAGVPTANRLVEFYMTCTEFINEKDIEDNTHYLVFTPNWFFGPLKANPNNRNFVRPFLAFKVGQGGSVNPEEPWKPLEQPKVGSWIGTDGQFYDKCIDAQTNTGYMPAAYVVWLGGNKRVENTGSSNNGLAIALNDIQGKALFAADLEKVACTKTNAPAPQYIAGHCDGNFYTKKLFEKKCGETHSHPAAEAVWTKAKIDNEAFSEWFIPEAGQWDLAMQGMGYGTYSDLGNNMWGYTKNGSWASLAAEMPSAALKTDKRYMTMTTYSKLFSEGYNRNVEGKIYTFDMNTKTFITGSQISSDYRIRPFVAFRYGGGGSVVPAQHGAPLAAPQVKSWMGDDGKFYKEVNDVFNATGYMPVAYVAYYGAEGSIEVSGKKYRGLAIGIYPDDDRLKEKFWEDADAAAKGYASLLYDYVIEEQGYSGWFLPEYDHWKMAIEQGFGFQFDQHSVVPENKAGEKVAEINNVFISSGLSRAVFNGFYWTASKYDKRKVIVIDLKSNNPVQFRDVSNDLLKEDNEPFHIRPMIAF